MVRAFSLLKANSCGCPYQCFWSCCYGVSNSLYYLDALVGSHQLEGSDKISIRAPDIAENGAVVPISVTTDIANAESISIVAEKNATPLSASFLLGPGAMGFVSTRIKMGKTSSVIAVVKADGKLYSTGKEVKVTIGGCGG